MGCVGSYSLEGDMKGQCCPYGKVPKLVYKIAIIYNFLFRIGVDTVTFPSREPMSEGSKCISYDKNSKLCIRFLFSISISGDSSSYFLEMIMLIGSVGNMTQTKIMVGKKTYPG